MKFNDVTFISYDEVANANVLFPWWIYVLELNIVWFHDLTIMLIHDSIMIDRLIMMKSKAYAH